ncbi:MAG: hypothetical protein HRU20_14580 [Pseudomonadales bacterium]|nr:hypothetical protein [Pseudomonadales bacterium]
MVDLSEAHQGMIAARLKETEAKALADRDRRIKAYYSSTKSQPWSSKAKHTAESLAKDFDLELNEIRTILGLPIPTKSGGNKTGQFFPSEVSNYHTQ